MLQKTWWWDSPTPSQASATVLCSWQWTQPPNAPDTIQPLALHCCESGSPVPSLGDTGQHHVAAQPIPYWEGRGMFISLEGEGNFSVTSTGKTSCNTVFHQLKNCVGGHEANYLGLVSIVMHALVYRSLSGLGELTPSLACSSIPSSAKANFTYSHPHPTLKTWLQALRRAILQPSLCKAQLHLFLKHLAHDKWLQLHRLW